MSRFLAIKQNEKVLICPFQDAMVLATTGLGCVEATVEIATGSLWSIIHDRLPGNYSVTFDVMLDHETETEIGDVEYRPAYIVTISHGETTMIQIHERTFFVRPEDDMFVFETYDNAFDFVRAFVHGLKNGTVEIVA